MSCVSQSRMASKILSSTALLDRVLSETRCKVKPECSPPGYTLRHVLIIVNWSVNWFACVQRSTCTSCRIARSRGARAQFVVWVWAWHVLVVSVQTRSVTRRCRCFSTASRRLSVSSTCRCPCRRSAVNHNAHLPLIHYSMVIDWLLLTV